MHGYSLTQQKALMASLMTAPVPSLDSNPQEHECKVLDFQINGINFFNGKSITDT